MKKFVRIQSDREIEVYEGLQYIDMTNPDAHVADRLRVSSAWVQTRVHVKQGTGYYPACVQNWAVVKNLRDKGIFTIGEELDEVDDEYANEAYNRIQRVHAERDKRIAETKADAARRTAGKKKADTNDLVEAGSNE